MDIIAKIHPLQTDTFNSRVYKEVHSLFFDYQTYITMCERSIKSRKKKSRKNNAE